MPGVWNGGFGRLKSWNSGDRRAMEFKTKYEGIWKDAREDTVDIKTGSWRFQRPVTKVGKCRQCGVCYLFCPGGCIKDEGTFFAADLDYCKGCGICANECPVDAISMKLEGEG